MEKLVFKYPEIELFQWNGNNKEELQKYLDEMAPKRYKVSVRGHDNHLFIYQKNEITQNIYDYEEHIDLVLGSYLIFSKSKNRLLYFHENFINEYFIKK